MTITTMEVPQDAIEAARAKLRERAGQTGRRLGGKGTARRKTKKIHKTNVGDDKKLSQVMKRIGASNLPGIEEVQMLKEDGNMLYFSNPKVQAAPAANTYIINGHCEEKNYADIVPQLLQQFGGVDNSQISSEIVRQLHNLQGQTQAWGNNTGGVGELCSSGKDGKIGGGGSNLKEDDEDDVPELIENFEEVSKQ